jgi:hypothetical protein
MHDADRPAFAALLTDVLAFYRQDVSRFSLSVWWQACVPFALEQVTKAMTAHAVDPERGQFAPKPADIVRQLAGTQTDRSLLAWGRVHAAMATVGAYASVAFDDRAIHAAVVDMGGWPKLCRSTLDELPFVQRRFCEAHRAYSSRPDAPAPAVLIGESEAANMAAGRGASQALPVLIGDRPAAERIARGESTQPLVLGHAAQALRLADVSADRAMVPPSADRMAGGTWVAGMAAASAVEAAA